MAFTVKPIRPEKLKVDSIRLEILNELRKEGRLQVKTLQKTVKTWRNKANFGFSIGLTGKDASVRTGITGGKGAQQWQWLDEGTRAHRVPRSGTATMAFHPKYGRKSRPRYFTSYRGGPRGRRIVRHGAWTVKGIKAREWTPTLVKRRTRPFQRNIAKATERGAGKMYKK